MLDVGCSVSPVPQEPSLWLLTHRVPPGPFPLIGRQSRRSLAGASPETRRSTSDRRSEVLRRVSGEAPARPARGAGAVSEGIPGGLIIVIWQPHHQGFSASHWHPGTSVVEDSRRLDGAESFPGVQVCIPGSVRVLPPWCMGVLRQFSRYSCTSASSSPRLKADLRHCRAFSLFLHPARFALPSLSGSVLEIELDALPSGSDRDCRGCWRRDGEC
jgi:hypothetical protein